MLLTRRELIKKAGLAGGLILAKPSPLLANWWAMTGSGSAASWGSWNETSEVGLASNDTYVCFFESGSAPADEIGQGGGLVTPNLTLTQGGTVAAATGTPPSRAFDGINGVFTFTSTLADLLAGGGNWTIISKLKVISNNASEAPFALTGAQDHIYAMFDGAGKILFRCQKDTVNKLNTTSTDAMSMNQVGYIGLWYDGTYIRGGFIDDGSPTPNTKPTKWSDFNANDRASATDTISWVAGDFDNNRTVGAYIAFALQATIYYIVVSKTCLINNAS